MNKRIVNCPTCGKPVEWSKENPWRPFCCERCKLIDLGAWAEGDHYIPGEPHSPLMPESSDEDER